VSLTFWWLAAAPVILVLCLVLPPGDRSARWVLRRWAPHVEPTPERVGLVARRLARCRVPTVGLLFAVWFGLPLLDLFDLVVLGWPSVLACLLAGLAIGEALSALDHHDGAVRAATLRARRMGDLVPRRGLVLHAVATVATIWIATYLLTLEGSVLSTDVAPAQLHPLLEARQQVWLALLGSVVSAALTVAVLRLATTRRALGDAEVDAALRARSARVAVGVGVALTGSLLANACVVMIASSAGHADNTGFWRGIDALFVLGGIGVWIMLANPLRPGLRAAAPVVTRRPGP
jgi:hypothetical protein